MPPNRALSANRTSQKGVGLKPRQQVVEGIDGQRHVGVGDKFIGPVTDPAPAAHEHHRNRAQVRHRRGIVGRPGRQVKACPPPCVAVTALTLSVLATGVIARLSRSAMLEVLRADYIRTARAKGLRESRVVWLHALKTAMVSILPILGLQAGFVLSGAVYIEMVFQWPGVGRMLVDAILKRDIMLVQGGVVFVASCYVLFNIIVDVLQTLLDSRIKT